MLYENKHQTEQDWRQPEERKRENRWYLNTQLKTEGQWDTGENNQGGANGWDWIRQVKLQTQEELL